MVSSWASYQDSPPGLISSAERVIKKICAVITHNYVTTLFLSNLCLEILTSVNNARLNQASHSRGLKDSSEG